MDTYEKKYKEALEWARKVMQGKVGFVLDEVLEKFPELKESEDEQHRKWTLEYLYDGLQKSDEQFKGQFKCAIAWLEKQGQTFTKKDVDDAYLKGICDAKHELEKQGEQPKKHDVCDNCEQQGSCVSPCPMKLVEKHGEQNPAWSEEDEKMIRALVSMCDVWATSHQFYPKENKEMEVLKTWLKSLKERVQPKQEWKQENTGDLTNFENAMMHIGGSFFGENAGLDPNDTNAIKEQANLLLELVSKQEWSEEDERLCLCLIEDQEEALDKVRNDKYGHSEIISDLKEMYHERINFLKSLKDRYTWKPTEEQMDALDYYANSLCTYCDRQDDLRSLFNVLKKLKG